jgi:hypothetical protein
MPGRKKQHWRPHHHSRFAGRFHSQPERGSLTPRAASEPAKLSFPPNVKFGATIKSVGRCVLDNVEVSGGNGRC